MMVSEMEKAGWFVAGILGEDALEDAEDMLHTLPDGLIALRCSTWATQDEWFGLIHGQMTTPDGSIAFEMCTAQAQELIRVLQAAVERVEAMLAEHIE